MNGSRINRFSSELCSCILNFSLWLISGFQKVLGNEELWQTSQKVTTVLKH